MIPGPRAGFEQCGTPDRVVGPLGKDIVAKLNKAPNRSATDPQIKNHHENLGLRMPPADQWSPEALDAWQKAEIAKGWPMIKAANVKAD
jgi:hypothetical protein